MKKRGTTELRKVISIEFRGKELKQLEAMAELTGLDISKLLRACFKQSAGSVRQKYVRDFVKKAQAMPDPFENDPVFDLSDRPFEEKVLEKELAWKKECEKPGSIDKQKIAYKDKFRHGYSAQDIASSVDDRDRILAEQPVEQNIIKKIS